MMNMRMVVVGWVLLTLTACNYKPTDEFFREIDQNVVPPAIQLNINTSSDTVYIPKEHQPRIWLSTGVERNQWVILYLNDVEQSRYFSSDGNFNLDLGNSISSPGMYKLKIEVYLSTGTGSIADKLDAEHFLFERVWWLMVSENPALGAVITGAAPDNGNLRISWTPFKGLGFGCYVLLRSPRGEWNYDTISIINNVHDVDAIDTSYIGEASTYLLVVYSGAPPFSGFDQESSSSYDYYFGFPELTLTPVNEKDLLLSWGRSEFINHIRGYNIMIEEEYNSGQYMMVNIGDRDTTSYIFKDPKFTLEYTFTVTWLPFKPVQVSDYGEYSGSISGFSGDTSFSCYSLALPEGNDLWYLNSGRIYRYDVLSDMTVDSLLPIAGNAYSNLSVSPNNKFLVSVSYAGFMLFYNIETGVSRLVYPSEISPLAVTFSTAHVADNGIGVVSDYDNLYSYDFIHNQLINTATPTGQFWMNSISADGRHIFLQNNYQYYCYRFTGQEFTKVWENQGNLNKVFWFHPGDPEKVILYAGHSLSVTDINTWVNQSTVTLEADNLINPDIQAGRVLGRKSDAIQVYNIATGNPEMTLSANSLHLHGILLKGDHLYSMEGHQLKIF
jgi:hypothetical protein